MSELMTPCEDWQGNRLPTGYGYMHVAMIDGKQIKMYTHRLVWMQTFGHTDLLVCHHCDNPSCINLEHLYAGTQMENMEDVRERGRHWNTIKTQCKHGHEFDKENTYIPKDGFRHCRQCRILYMRRYHQKVKAEGNR